MYRGTELSSLANRVRSTNPAVPTSSIPPPICFEWGNELWFPAFQFNPLDMTLRPGAAQVVAELGSVFDGWELAGWFVEPSVWLGNARPVDLISTDAESVLGAARADRFIAVG